MSLASRLADLTLAMANAINTRAKIGASAYDLAVFNGYTGTQPQWLAQMNRPPQTDNFPWWFETTGYSLSAGAGSGSAATLVVAGSSAQNTGLICKGAYLQNAASVALATPAPTTNGQWYYIYVDVVWTNGIAGATPKVVAGPTTANTTVPTTVPTTLPQAIVNTPGTRVTVPLNWYWIAAGASIGTTFDLRVFTSGTGRMTAPNLHALYIVNPVLPSGAEVRILPFTGASGELHIDSLWVKANGSVYCRGRISGGATLGLRNDIDALVTAYSLNYTSSPNGGDVALYYDSSTNFEWARASGGWYLLWGDSPPSSLTFAGTVSWQNNDATSFHQLRKTPGGKVTWSFYLNVNGTPPTIGNTFVTLPQYFRPMRTAAFTAAQWSSANWKGIVSLEINQAGQVSYKFSTAALSSNDGIFGTIDFVA